MTGTYGAAIIGLGVIGRRMLTNMPRQGRLEVRGGFDLDAEAARGAQAEFPWLKLAETAESLIASPDVDLVYIGTPPKAHAAYARLAAESGKAVFCEKPLGVDVAESRALTAEIGASRSGVAPAVNLSLAGAAGVAVMREALATGALGRLAGADIRLHFAKWPRGWQENAAWLAQREQGGFTREVATHFIFLAERLLGPAALLERSARYPDDGAGAETHALARLDCGGTPVTLAGSVGGAGPDLVEFTLWGENRSYRLTDFYRFWESQREAWSPVEPAAENPALEAYMRQLDELVKRMDGEPDILPGFAEALRAQEIVEAILA